MLVLRGARLCDHAAAVPAVRRVLRASGSVPRQNGGHSSCTQILVRTVHTVQQTVEISQVQFWGWLWTRLLLCNNRCLVGSRNALFDDGYVLCIIQGGFWKNFTIVYMKGLTRLDSRPAFSPCGRHIVDNGSAVFPRVPAVCGEVHG